MPNPKGNPGNKGGKPGFSGRPSVKETMWHKDKWEQESLLNALETKIASGRYSIRDMWLYKALRGDIAILKQAADKVLADLHDVSTAGEPIRMINYIIPQQGTAQPNEPIQLEPGKELEEPKE